MLACPTSPSGHAARASLVAPLHALCFSLRHASLAAQPTHSLRCRELLSRHARARRFALSPPHKIGEIGPRMHAKSFVGPQAHSHGPLCMLALQGSTPLVVTPPSRQTRNLARASRETPSPPIALEVGIELLDTRASLPRLPRPRHTHTYRLYDRTFRTVREPSAHAQTLSQRLSQAAEGVEVGPREREARANAASL